MPVQLIKAIEPALALDMSVEARQRAISDAIALGDSEIQRVYSNATLLLTGGSGFLGKQMLEKLFRSCKVKKVYVLLRPKKGKCIQERIEVLLTDPVFDDLRVKQPGFAASLVPVAGDVSEERLGISDHDWDTLVEEVDMIIHAAATVNFDEPLKVATLTNVRGTIEMLTLGRTCKKLRSFVHVSTAYSHATRSRFNRPVLEQFYSSPASPEDLIQMVTSIDEGRLKDITLQLIEDWPNTYTFTKAVAEEAVRTMGQGLPICIVRPAIVISSYTEPSPGWLDISCAYGPSGLILGSGLGLIHVIMAASDIKIDFVPVDQANNAVLAAGWANTLAPGGQHIHIYTVTNMRNCIHWSTASDMFNEMKPKYATPRCMWYSFVIYTGNIYLYTVLSWLLHTVPSYIIDGVCWVMGKPQIFRKIYAKASKLTHVLSYFTCNEWNFKDDNLLSLYKSLSPIDKVIFNFDTASINWREQITFWGLGVRKYIIKDGLKNTDYAVKKQRWLKILNYAVMTVYFYLWWKLGCVIFNFMFCCY